MSLQASVKAIYRGLGEDLKYRVQPEDKYVSITIPSEYALVYETRELFLIQKYEDIQYKKKNTKKYYDLLNSLRQE